MRSGRVACAAVALIIGASPSVARAAQSIPPASVQAEIIAAAYSYWAPTGTPQEWIGGSDYHVPCTPTLTFAPLPPGEGGATSFATCQITMDSQANWSFDGWHNLCIAETHEVGHTVLGPHAFLSTNPSDPSHSLDPASIMQESTADYSLDVLPCNQFEPPAPPAPPQVADPAPAPTIGPLLIPIPIHTAVSKPRHRRRWRLAKRHRFHPQRSAGHSHAAR